MAVLTHQTRQYRSKRFFEDLGDGQRLEMVLIRGGTFTMGSPADEEERNESEGPQHDVTLSTFLMGRYPVTQAQWRQVAGFDPVDSKVEFPLSPSGFGDKDDSDRRPVEQVSWYQAKEFCARLSHRTKRNYRLPSEAEWEYACRAGTTTPFYCGETITTDIANYDGNYTYGRGPNGKYRKETTPVDHFEMVNPWGLCDMHGNVWEWCLDPWHENYEGAPLDGRPWLENPSQSNRRVLRGGSWGSRPRYCRSASRSLYAPDIRSYSFGFRVVLAPP
ncbi:MAG: formylglycine-generating enzyme family protein [Leptolyngbyaceae bacterium]|nr:formylglycine-generating enzyme family protein [Leptolyngbyaceae bacterium]